PAFLLPDPRAPRDLHSFPTRRSSDLIAERLPHVGAVEAQLGQAHHAIDVQPGIVSADGVQGAANLLPRNGRRTAEFQKEPADSLDRKSTRLNSSHVAISYAVFCLKKK